MSHFNGTWACESTEGLDSVLKELNVGMIKRKVACSMKPILTINFKPDNSGFSFKNDKKDNNREFVYNFGTPLDDEIGGAPGKITWSLEENGSKMVGKFVFKKNPDNFTVTERTVENGKLVQKLSFKGKTSVRTFGKK